MTTNYTIFNGGKDEVNFETNGVYSDKKITNKEIGAASTYFTIRSDGSSRGKFLYVQTPPLIATQGASPPERTDVAIVFSPDGLTILEM